MNFMQPPGQVDPRDLTSGQLAALRTVKEYRLSRVKNGWRAPGSPLVTLATMQILGAKRLVIRRDVNGKPQMDLTGTGLNTLSVADGRARKFA